jgi:hypothetical protein
VAIYTSEYTPVPPVEKHGHNLNTAELFEKLLIKHFGYKKRNFETK